MSDFNIAAETPKNTVVTEYEPTKQRSYGYQRESSLEKEFIAYYVSKDMNIYPYTRKRI